MPLHPTNKKQEMISGEPSFTEHGTYVHSEDWPSLDQAVSKAGTDGTPFDLVFRIIRPGEEIGWMHAIGRALLDDEGKVAKLFGTAQDITDLKEAEKALRESEQKFRSLVDQAAEMLFLHDLKGNLMDVNRVAVKNTGYTKEELEKMTVFDIDPDAHDRQDMANYWEALKPQDAPVTFGARHKRKDGSVYPAEISVSKVVLADGEYILGLARDITERMIAEKRLRESEERLRMIAENTGAMIGILTSQGIYEFVNPAHRIMGYEPDELIGTSGFNLIHPDDVKRLAEILQKGLQGELSRVTTTYRAKHKDGRTLTIEGTFDSIWSKDGQLKKIVFVGDDITERKQMEEQLHQAQKMETVGRLAGGGAHDFNNMLGIIVGNAEMAGMQLDEKEPTQRNVREILNNLVLNSRDAMQNGGDITIEI